MISPACYLEDAKSSAFVLINGPESSMLDGSETIIKDNNEEAFISTMRIR